MEEKLPPRLAPLAGPAAGALHQLAPQVAQRALSSPRFESLWSNANRRAHERLLEIVNGGGSTVSTSGGEVVLDLNSLLTQIGGQLGGNLASKVPADAGQLTILKSEQLSTAQDIVSLIRRLPIVLTLLAIVLYALAIYLAGPRRREALRGVGFSFIVAGVLVLVLRHFGGSAVIDALAKSDSVKPAVEAVWSIATSLLVTVAVSAITFGILLALGAWLAGPIYLMPVRPILSGICLGLLSYKPQYGLLFPLALIAASQWTRVLHRRHRGVWRWPLHRGSPSAPRAGRRSSTGCRCSAGLPHRRQGAVVEDAELFRAGAHLRRHRTTGMDIPLDSHGLGGGGAGADVAEPGALLLKAAALAVGTLLTTPYLFMYDMMVLAIPVAFLVRMGFERFSRLRASGARLRACHDRWLLHSHRGAAWLRRHADRGRAGPAPRQTVVAA